MADLFQKVEDIKLWLLQEVALESCRDVFRSGKKKVHTQRDMRFWEVIKYA